jgi:predicted dienelactone hydrolase
MRRAVALAAVLFAAIAAHAARAAEQVIALAGLSVTAWAPDTAPAAKAPVIIFSHGFHGCATQSRFLMKALAGAGYVVFAPNHHDATCDGGDQHWRDKSEVPFGDVGAWTDTSYRDRGDDIRRLIDALKNDEHWRDRLDWSRLGLAGHSLGGYTVLALAGGWPRWRLDGVKAVLALSPYAQPCLKQRTLGGLAAPVMYQGGTLDVGITPWLRKSTGAYDQSPSPKYFVEFAHASHFAWTDFGRVAHDAIIEYSLAFLDHYVRGAPAAPILSGGGAGVADYRYASELGSPP